MDVLNIDDTKAGAVFLLRQLVKGDNTSIELRNSMIRADVDDSYCDCYWPIILNSSLHKPFGREGMASHIIANPWRIDMM